MAAQADFWGELGSADVRTPVSLLREQASILGEKTHHVVEAKVETRASGGEFIHSLNLVVPALDEYEYQLLRIRHGVDIYPVTDINGNMYRPMGDEDSFLEWLHQQLSSPQTRKVIENLLALANS